MTKQRDELIEMLGMGISRRKMLKGMGYGLAGAAIAPTLVEEVWAAAKRAPAKLSDSTPQPIWDYTAPSSYYFYDFPLLDNGTIILTAQSTPFESAADFVLYSLDSQTKAVRWSHSFDGPINTPLSVNGLLYAATQGGITNGSINAIDPSTGKVLWQKDYQPAADLALIGGNLVFTTTDGRIVALDLQRGDLIWSYQSSSGPASRAVASGSVVMVLIAGLAGTLVAVDSRTGTFLWNYAAPARAQTELSVGGGNVYFRIDDTVHAVNVVSGKQAWTFTLSSDYDLQTSPVYYNGAVFVQDSSCNLYALHPDTGSELWQINVGDLINGEIFFEDGIAYFATGVASSSKIYAVDLPSQGQEVVIYDPSSNVAVIGVETGVCYFQYGQRLATRIGAVNLAGLIHEYFCESELMVEDYQSSTNSNGYQGNTSSYRTHVQLFDSNKNPRANKSVKVWASDAVTISSGGQTYDIDTADTGKSAWLQTDAAGELSIVSTAATVSSPALYLWANFMEVDEAIVIYPDHDTLHTLSNVQGSDLSQATAFDGTLLMPSGFTATEALAQTIRNTMGGGAAQAMLRTKKRHRQALAKKRRMKKRWSLGTAADTTYIAYPDSAPNLLYQPIVGSADRSYVSGPTQQWHAVFDSSGKITYNTGLPQLEGPLGWSIKGKFDQLALDVVNTAVKVSQVVWDDVKKVVTVVADDLVTAYQDTVDTIEKAVAVVAGVLKTVVGDIKRAVEWLSTLFDWKAILDTKDQIKSAVTQNFTNLKIWVNNQVSMGAASSVHKFFQNLEGTISNDFTQAGNLIGGSSLQSKQQNGNNPQTVYNLGGAKSYTKSRWLMSKTQDNLGQATTDSAASPPTDTTDPLLSNFMQLYDQVSALITDPNASFQSIPADVKNVFHDFRQLVTDPSDFVTRTFGDVITLIKDIAVGLLKLLDAIVEDVLKVLPAIIDALIASVTQPIKIPVVSDLYRLITNGDQLSFLDLFCLIVAIPTTIIEKALNTTMQASGTLSTFRAAQGLGQSNALVIAQLVANGIYAVVDVFSVFNGTVVSNADEAEKNFLIADTASSIVLLGLSFPSDIATNTAGDYIFYAAQLFPIASTGVGALIPKLLNPLNPFKIVWTTIGAPLASCAYGLAMLGASIGLGIENINYRGNDYLGMCANIFGFLPSVASPLSLAGEDGKTGLLLITGVGDLTAFILDAVNAALDG